MTQAVLAERLGFDQSYVSKVESGGRDIRDVDALRRIAEVLVVAPEEVGLARGGFWNEGGSCGGAQGVIAQSQRRWRLVRGHLNRSREELSWAAAALYDGCSMDGSRSPLLGRSDWLFAEPVDFGQIRLRWAQDAAPPIITGCEPEADLILPLSAPGGRRYHRYTRAIRDLDRPTLFESRASFRLVAVGDFTATSPCMTFGHTTYFDMVDVCEAVAHELAAADMAGKEFARRMPPFRRLIGDPFDLGRRSVLPSINTLTIRRDPRGASFILHDRNPAQVAVAGGMYHLIPAGVFQPASISPLDEVNDFDLWRNVMREFSEEFLGSAEHDGSGARCIDYDSDEPFRSLNAARRSGKLRIVCFGIGLDPLTLAGEILAAAVIDGDVFDDIFRELVSANAEGALVTSGTRVAAGIPFEHRNVERLLTCEPMAPAAAGCLELAWRHRDALLSA